MWPASVAQLDVRLTGDQEVADSTPAGSATFFRGDLIMKYFLRSFEKYQNILSEHFHFLVVKFSVYLNKHV